MSPEEWLKQKEQNSKDTSLESFGAPGTTKEDIKAGILSEEDINVRTPTSRTRKEEGKEQSLSPEEWLAKNKKKPSTKERQVVPFVQSLNKGGQFGLDLADVVASTPAFLGGAGAGLVAAEAHAADPTKPAGEHFGAANAVFEAVMEVGGNPIRKALTGAGIVGKAEGSTSGITDIFNWLNKKNEAASEWVGETTGSKEAQEATKFGLTTVGPPIAIKGGMAAAKGTYKGTKAGLGKAKDAIVKDVEQPKPISEEYAESKIKPEESIPDVLARKRERENPTTTVSQEETNRPVTLEDKESPKYLYHGTRIPETALLDKDGNLILNPSKNFGGKTTSISLTHNKDFAKDYAARIKGGMINGKPAFNFSDSKVIKIESDALPEGISRESGEEWAFNQEEPIIIPKGKFTIEEHSLKGKKEFDIGKPPQSWADWLRENFDREEINDIHNDSQKGETYQREYYKQMAERDPNYAEHLEKQKQIKVDFAKERDQIDKVVEQRSTGTYQEPSVEWNVKKDVVEQVKESALENINEFILSEQRVHGTVLQGVTDVLAKSANSILAATRTADIFSKTIEKAIPENEFNGKLVPEMRDKMFRAAEAQKPWDKLLPDKPKKELIYGTGEVDPRTGFKNEGLTGALAGMKINLAKGKIPKGLTAEQYQVKIDALDFSIKRLKRIGSEEKAISLLKEITARIDAIGDNAVKLGLLDSLRTNYIPHVLDWSKFKGTELQKKALLDKIQNAPQDSKLVRDFTARRKYAFARELEKAVEGTGVVVLTDIAKVTLAYEKAMQTAIIHKAMFDYLKTNKDPQGRPWVLPDGAEAKAAGYVSFEGHGTRAIRDLRVHPDLVDSMKFLFRQNDPNIILRTLGGINYLVKSINVVGSLFHAKSLMEAGLLTDPKLFASEVGKEVLHIVFKRGEGSGARQALKAFTEGGNEAMTTLYLKEGLTIAVEDVQKTIVAETGVFLDQMASRLAPKGKEVQLIQHITEPLDRVVIQNLNKFTWDYMHAAQKLNVAFHLHQKMKLKNPEMSDVAIAREVSLYVNNTFGGLNWLEVANSVNNKYLRAAALKMGGIAGREWAQLILFAPDWTVSTLRAFTSALPKELAKPQNWELRKGVAGIVNPKTANDLARRYVINTALAWTTIINGINLAVSGQPIWENRDPTRVQFQDGTSMQAAKHSMEAVHWLMNPDKTLGNKLAFFPKALFVSTTGIAYPSPDAPKLKDTSALGRTKAIGLLAAPFPVSSAIQAPEGEGAKRAISSMLGAPVYGISDEARAKSIKKGKAEAKLKRLKEKRGY